ncbi:MAG: alpha/beta fold hydrolase [Thermodesulfobacteriota bacterium]
MHSKHKSLILSILLVLCLPAVVFGEQVIADGYYKITARHSGKALDVQYGSTANGADIIQYSENGGDNQIWLLQYDPDADAYLVMAKHSEKCLDVRYGATSNGTDACQWDWNDQENQKWEIDDLGDGYYKLTARHSGKSLEVSAGSYWNVASVQQWDYNGKAHQQWKLSRLPIYYPGPSDEQGECATQYPIVLVHGIALSDSTLGYNYFGRIPNYLRSHGARVEGGGQNAWSDNADNGKQLREKILRVCDAYGVDKVNVIAHSKGSLDTRAMFKDYPQMADRVASFTSIASPHRGSVLADMLFEAVPDDVEPYVGSMIDVIGLILQGDDSPDSLAAGKQLTRAEMEAFNDECGDIDSGIPGVYCQSYGARIKGVVPDLALQASSTAMELGGESPNDGAVWTESTPYANFKGIESGASWCGGVTHFGIVDRGILIFPGYTPGFDARAFYRDIVADLKDRGY